MNCLLRSVHLIRQWLDHPESWRKDIERFIEAGINYRLRNHSQA